MNERARPATDAGVHSLDHFALAIPDLNDARAFYGAFGLDVKDEGDALGVVRTRQSASLGCGPQRLTQAAVLAFVRRLRARPRALRRAPESARDQHDRPARRRAWRRPLVPRHGRVACSYRRRCEELARREIGACPSELRRSRCAWRWQAKRGAAGSSAPPGARPAVHARRPAHGRRSTKTCSACGCPIDPATSSRSCMRCTAAITMCVAFAKSNAPGYHHSSWDVGRSTKWARVGMQMAAPATAKGWGVGAARAGLELLLLCAGPVGELGRVQLRHRLRAGRYSTGRPPTMRPRTRSTCGGRGPPSDFVINHESTVRRTLIRRPNTPAGGEVAMTLSQRVTRQLVSLRGPRARRWRSQRSAQSAQRADPHRQHARAHRAARRDRPRAQGCRRDLRRAAQQARRPARPAGRVGRQGRPEQARPRAHALRAARHRRQGRPADGAVRDRARSCRRWASRSATTRCWSTTRSASRRSRSTNASSRPGRSVRSPPSRCRTRCSTRSPRRRSRRRRSPSSRASSRRCTSCRSARARSRRSAASTRCCSSNGTSATSTTARSRRASRMRSPTSSGSARSASKATSCSRR